jgi:hypothetical protein
MAAATVGSTTTDDTAQFFFDPFFPEPEATVQMLNQCGPFNRFWVSAQAITNVDMTIRVTDTEAGEIRTYFNPTGQVPPAITDTDAFATCPGPLPIPVP